MHTRALVPFPASRLERSSIEWTDGTFAARLGERRRFLCHCTRLTSAPVVPVVARLGVALLATTCIVETIDAIAERYNAQWPASPGLRSHGGAAGGRSESRRAESAGADCVDGAQGIEEICLDGGAGT